MADDLTPAMRQHLIELLDAPHWTPTSPGEWSIARALERRDYVTRNPTRGARAYDLTGKGRAAGEALLPCPECGALADTTTERCGYTRTVEDAFGHVYVIAELHPECPIAARYAAAHPETEEVTDA